MWCLGEIELAIMVEKTIMSVGAGGDKFKYLDLDTQLLEVEAGVAVNEPGDLCCEKDYRRCSC